MISGYAAKSMIRIRLTLVSVALIAVGTLPAAIEQPVHVDGGLIAGVPGRDPSILAFKGIPFAAPPVGDLRWREPKPVIAWRGVRKTAEFSSSCIQKIRDELKPWTYEFMTHNSISENCLYLNVWTPARSAREKRPVIVFIHGGAFNSGSAAVPIYDGEGLAKKGLVVVTINYRLGGLGYLALAELTRESPHHASGNYGMLDQLAALRWVQTNIGQFGGDPTRVAVAGQSAGSIAVHQLTASPLGKGLFQRAIMESGGSTIGQVGIRIAPKTLAGAEAEGEKYMHAAGATTLSQLRAMSWQKLMNIEQAMRFAPIVDGYSLPAPVATAFSQGKQNDVASLTGVNAGELQGLTGPQAEATTLDAYRQHARDHFGDHADEFLKLYPAENQGQVKSVLEESSRDANLTAMYLWARLRAKTSNTAVYEYFWNHALPGPDAERFGAFHSSELPYVLNTLSTSDRPFTVEDRRIAEEMSSYWANFTLKGDPNGEGLAQWKPVGTMPRVMEVGDDFKEVPTAGNEAKFAFWKSVLLTQP